MVIKEKNNMADQAKYVKLLQGMDWYYEYSDDNRVWQKGQTQYQDLLKIAKKVDPDFSIWNRYAPQDCQKQL